MPLRYQNFLSHYCLGLDWGIVKHVDPTEAEMHVWRALGKTRALWAVFFTLREQLTSSWLSCHLTFDLGHNCISPPVSKQRTAPQREFNLSRRFTFHTRSQSARFARGCFVFLHAYLWKHVIVTPCQNLQEFPTIPRH